MRVCERESVSVSVCMCVCGWMFAMVFVWEEGQMSQIISFRFLMARACFSCLAGVRAFYEQPVQATNAQISHTSIGTAPGDDTHIRIIPQRQVMVFVCEQPEYVSP